MTGQPSPRQLEVLRHLAEGLRDQDISKVMFVSAPTTRRQVKLLLNKLGARNRAQAVHIGHQRGLIT